MILLRQRRWFVGAEEPPPSDNIELLEFSRRTHPNRGFEVTHSAYTAGARDPHCKVALESEVASSLRNVHCDHGFT